jgi:hypothetical protein
MASPSQSVAGVANGRGEQRQRQNAKDDVGHGRVRYELQLRYIKKK